MVPYIIISNVAFQVVNKNVDGESENRQRRVADLFDVETFQDYLLRFCY